MTKKIQDEEGVLDVAHKLFKFFRDQEIDIPVAMGGLAAALSLMGARLGVEQKQLLGSFKTTMELLYADEEKYDESKRKSH